MLLCRLDSELEKKRKEKKRKEKKRKETKRKEKKRKEKKRKEKKRKEKDDAVRRSILRSLSWAQASLGLSAIWVIGQGRRGGAYPCPRRAVTL